MAVDYTALVNAVARLAEGLTRYRLDTTDAQIRDGLIQRFEFTYDLSHKMLRRALEHRAKKWVPVFGNKRCDNKNLERAGDAHFPLPALEEAAANPADIDRMGFPTLIRTAVEQGLIAGDWPSWRTFREMRNMTSHSYDEAKALQVAAAIPGFLEEAHALVERLQTRGAE